MKPIFQAEDLERFCRQYGVKKISLFGSVLRADFCPDSDVDVLVEFQPEAKPTLFTLSRMQRELSNLLQGREVDLLTPEDLSPYFQEAVLAQAVVQYVSE